MFDTDATQLQQLLLSVVRSIVESPDDVWVQLTSKDHGPVFHIAAGPSDLGRLIGNGGQTARALEVMVNAGHPRPGPRFHIEIAPTAHA